MSAPKDMVEKLTRQVFAAGIINDEKIDENDFASLDTARIQRVHTSVVKFAEKFNLPLLEARGELRATLQTLRGTAPAAYAEEKHPSAADFAETGTDPASARRVAGQVERIKTRSPWLTDAEARIEARRLAS